MLHTLSDGKHGRNVTWPDRQFFGVVSVINQHWYLVVVTGSGILCC